MRRAGSPEMKRRILPEILAGAGAAAAMQAVDHGRGDRGALPGSGAACAAASVRPAPVARRVASARRGPCRLGSAIRSIRCATSSCAMTLPIVSPSARAAKVSAMRCFSTGSASREHVVDRGREPSVEQRAGAHRQHQRLAGARARAPGDQLAEIAGFRAGTRRAHQRAGSPRPRTRRPAGGAPGAAPRSGRRRSSPPSAWPRRRRWCRTGCAARPSRSG